jgi:circadian clock protein KaiC
MLRVPTGIEGLDEMLDGGFPKGRVILLCGGPGTGKTIFSLQFLFAAAERGEPGVYVTLEEPLDFIRENVEAFDWKLKEKELENRLKLLHFKMPNGDSKGGRCSPIKGNTFSIVDDIAREIEAIKAEHVVIDPITSITVQEQRAGFKRQRIAELFGKLRDIGCTSVLTSEITSVNGEFYMEEFLADGVIRLDKTVHAFTLIKTIRIEKMRGIKYDEQPRRYVIDKKGFKVYSSEPVKV